MNKINTSYLDGFKAASAFSLFQISSVCIVTIAFSDTSNTNVID